MNKEQKFLAFLEAMKANDPKLVGVIMEGYQAIYEGPLGKFLGMIGLATGIASASGAIDQSNVVNATNKYITNIQNEYLDDGTVDRGELINSENNKTYAELENIVKTMKAQSNQEKDPAKKAELEKTLNTIVRIVDATLDNKLGVLDPKDNLNLIR